MRMGMQIAVVFETRMVLRVSTHARACACAQVHRHHSQCESAGVKIKIDVRAQDRTEAQNRVRCDESKARKKNRKKQNIACKKQNRSG
jgi:hypothetical protein